MSADDSAKHLASEFKGQHFVMKANEALFPASKHSFWTGKDLYEAALTLVDGRVSIGTNSDWVGSYFISGQTYVVKDVKDDRKSDSLIIKLQNTGLSKTELQLDFLRFGRTSPEDFKRLFFGVFFSPGDDEGEYQKENDLKLVHKFIDSEPELAALSQDARLQLLETMRLMSLLSPAPVLERVGESLYVPASVIGGLSEYNDVRVSKNQRIASSIEAIVPEIRRIAGVSEQLPDPVKGVRLDWNSYHRNFVEKDSRTVREEMQLLVPREVLRGFQHGNLSAFELVQKSILRENGTKVTLTSYDPIGAN